MNFTEFEPTSKGERRWSSELINFGIRDPRGRSLGTVAFIEEHIPGRHEYTPEYREAYDKGVRPDFSKPMYVFVPDGRPKVYTVRTQAQRGGEPFGATSSGTIAKTFEEAKKLAEKKVTAAKKRAEKVAVK